MTTTLTKHRSLILACAVVLLSFYAGSAFVLVPLEDELASLNDERERLLEERSLLQQLKREQGRLANLMQAARSSVSGENVPSLLSTVEDLVKQLKLSEKAINMRPVPVAQTMKGTSEERLEIRFVTLGFRSLLQFLDKIESLPSNVRIETLDIRKTGSTATMTLVISSLLFGTRN